MSTPISARMNLSVAVLDPRDRGQQLPGARERADQFLHSGVEPGDRGDEVVDVVQQLAHEQSMVVVEAARDGQTQLLGLGPQPTPRQPGEYFGIAFTVTQGGQDQAGGNSADVGHDRVELDLGVFQELLQPKRFATFVLNESPAIAGHVA
jgi:hypothetical protein